MTNAKDLVTAFADTLERRDWPALAELLDANLIYEIPQTRERIRGRDRYVAFNAEYPGSWHIDPMVVLGDDHDGSLLFRWTVAGESSLGIAFFEIDGNKITKITDFWPEPYEPHAGREHLVERW
jgi:hypothetical protein